MVVVVVVVVVEEEEVDLVVVDVVVGTVTTTLYPSTRLEGTTEFETDAPDWPLTEALAGTAPLLTTDDVEYEVTELLKDTLMG